MEKKSDSERRQHEEDQPLAIGLFVFAGTDALQQCTPAAPVYRRALTQRRPVLLKLSATVLDTSEAAVPAAARKSDGNRFRPLQVGDLITNAPNRTISGGGEVG